MPHFFSSFVLLLLIGQCCCVSPPSSLPSTTNGNAVVPTDVIQVTAKPMPSFGSLQPSPMFSEINTPEASPVIDLSQY